MEGAADQQTEAETQSQACSPVKVIKRKTYFLEVCICNFIFAESEILVFILVKHFACDTNKNMIS